MTVELLHIKLSAFADAAPQNRAPFLMHFQHMMFSLFARITEHALEHHRHVTHQINRIVVDDDLPRNVEFVFTARFLFPDRRFHRGRGSLFEPHGDYRAHEKMLSHCLRSSNCGLGQNFLLCKLHFPGASFIPIVEAV